MSAGQPASDPVSDRERYPFKYYKTLLALELEEEDLSTLLIAESAGTGWNLRQAHLPVAQAACHDNYDELFDLLEVDSGGPSRRRIRQGGLSLAETAAWWLYARTQERLDNPLNLVIARAAAGAHPPASFQTLVDLSWEQWRSYAIARHLPPTDRPAWVETPQCEQWMNLYREVPAEALPFGVGEGLSQAVELVYNRRCALPEALPEPALVPGFAGDLWGLLLEKIRPEIDPTLAAIFLDRVVVRRQTAGELCLDVPDQTVRAYLVQTLGERLAREARLLTGTSWEIVFEVQNQHGEVKEAAALPVEIDQTESYRPMWTAVKNELALQMTRATFEQWLRQAELVYTDGRIFRIGVMSDSGRQWLDYRLKKNITRTLRAISRQDEVEIEFVVLAAAAAHG